MKTCIIVLLATTLSIACYAQSPSNIEAQLKYPDELVVDKSLMNYTVYKPNISIACKFPMRQVSKTRERTVFMSDEDSMKLSFAFFDLEKLPFYNPADSAYESSYKFFAWDSAARVKANMPPVFRIQSAEAKGILYYCEKSGNKTNLYLAGTKDNIISLVLFSGKDLQLHNVAGDMEISFKHNLRLNE